MSDETKLPEEWAPNRRERRQGFVPPASLEEGHWLHAEKSADLAAMNETLARYQIDLDEGRMTQLYFNAWYHRWCGAYNWRAAEVGSLDRWLAMQMPLKYEDPAVVAAKVAHLQAMTAESEARRAVHEANERIGRARAERAERYVAKTLADPANVPQGAYGKLLEAMHANSAQVIWVLLELQEDGVSLGTYAESLLRRHQKSLPKDYYANWLTSPKCLAWQEAVLRPHLDDER